jgi:uncharacterized protein YvpB
MRKLLALGAAILVVSFIIAYITEKPTITYVMGQIRANFSRPGRVAGSSVYRLDVPYHRQEHALSCEIASLKMALAWAGLNVPESELIAALPVDNTPRQNGVWGNPYQAFVGDIDGRMMQSGYGVYWDPVAAVGQRYRRTEAIRNGTLPELIYHLNQKRAVVVWGYFGRGQRMDWQAPDGGLVRAVNGEHARVLIGYTGSPTDPDSLILLDPIYGELQWTVPQFLANWAAVENGAVAVYGQPRWVRAFGQDTVWEISADGLTRHALAMDWNNFISQGGQGEAVNSVSAEWLASIQESSPILVLEN